MGLSGDSGHGERRPSVEETMFTSLSGEAALLNAVTERCGCSFIDKRVKKRFVPDGAARKVREACGLVE